MQDEPEDEDRDETPVTCWCGESGPYCDLFDDAVFEQSCGGLRTLHCECGGDFCVCHHHGEVECPGCEDCEDEDPDYDLGEAEQC